MSGNIGDLATTPWATNSKQGCGVLTHDDVLYKHSNPVLLSLRHIEDLHIGVVAIILTLDFIPSSPSSLWQKLRIRAKKVVRSVQEVLVYIHIVERQP
ncbi:hypothetical protein ARMSODRAFT_457218 [Armillaria solidipes]|uniref:Uncharacterized protein n=1 Tax=Armillaria solidipes TaxID=1076256 RepID=A0A2H3BF20_9AGAR|nr:hypothetical protein ARMSODRAFT_457218 [Armillaria solidipes]